ncbi:hypothetical protein ACEPAI_4922 [Sanghuangporus weigelae]
MAAMGAHPRPFNYGPGPSWGSGSQAPGRSPSSSRNAYPMYRHPYASSQYEEEEDETSKRDSFAAPDVRVTAPSRAEEAPRPDSVWSDDKSVYSERMSTTISAPQTFYSSLFQSGNASSHHLSAMSSTSEMSRDSWQGGARPDSNVDPFSFMKYESPRQQLPKVVVSSPSENSFRTQSQHEEAYVEEDQDAVIPHPITPPPFQPPQGRVPSAMQGTRNFSRPNRAAISTPDLSTKSQSFNRPLIPSSEEQKREVLERNQNRQRLGQGSPLSQPASPNASLSSPHLPPSSPSHARDEFGYGASGGEYMAVPGTRTRSPSPSRTPERGPELTLSQSSSSSSTSSNPSPRTPQGNSGLVVLPSSPPGVRVSATESVYSMYSYYNLDNTSPGSSPSTTTHFDQFKIAEVSNNAPSVSSPSPSGLTSPGKKGKSHSSAKHDDLPADPKTADDYLALGIAHHEADRLKESAECFEKSATLEGASGAGMLMWGLSLRHGWGVPKDEPRAFKWLKRAAEHAVVDLQQGRDGRDAVKKELVLAVYEVGQCFFQGWGVPKDKAMGVSYFQTAAQLGDPDAQQDLAFCLANGKGCKKDKKAAAKWYRAAAEQGASTVGLAWIHKPKYME